jgi:hypothetical protein
VIPVKIFILDMFSDETPALAQGWGLTARNHQANHNGKLPLIDMCRASLVFMYLQFQGLAGDVVE